MHGSIHPPIPVIPLSPLKNGELPNRLPADRKSCRREKNSVDCSAEKNIRRRWWLQPCGASGRTISIGTKRLLDSRRSRNHCGPLTGASYLSKVVPATHSARPARGDSYAVTFAACTRSSHVQKFLAAAIAQPEVAIGIETGGAAARSGHAGRSQSMLDSGRAACRRSVRPRL